MKRYFLLFLLAALACSCNDSEGDTLTGTGSETQQPVSADEILPRRLVSIDVTFADGEHRTETFAYDKQGRLASMTYRFDFGDEDTNESTTRYTYTNNTIVADDGYVYQLQNGRAVTVRYEDKYEQWEDTFSYDAAGYLVSCSFTDNDFRPVTYVSNGFSVKSKGDEWDYFLSVEFDRTRLNNLSLDFYGECWAGEEDMTGSYTRALLLGVGGQRWRYLPATMTTVNHNKENGEWYTDKGVYRYVYHMDGDYLSEVEVYVTYDNEPEEKY